MKIKWNYPIQKNYPIIFAKDGHKEEAEYVGWVSGHAPYNRLVKINDSHFLCDNEGKFPEEVHKIVNFNGATIENVYAIIEDGKDITVAEMKKMLNELPDDSILIARTLKGERIPININARPAEKDVRPGEKSAPGLGALFG